MMAWGPFTLTAPALLYGLAACAVPILIHLVMRQRARRQVFPAMRLLMTNHARSDRAHRLKHLLLLLCRMGVLALVVLLLAGTQYTPAQSATGHAPALVGSAPVSAIFCVDTSASMGYRYQGRTRLQWALQAAAQLLADGRHLPAGSEIAAVSGMDTPGTWHENPAAARRALDALHAEHHAAGVASLLERAYRTFDTARHDRREVYVFTDLMQAAWQDTLPEAPTSVDGVYVIDVGQTENRSTALGWPEVSAHVIPRDRAWDLRLMIRTGDAADEPAVELRVDGQPRLRQAVPPLEPNTEKEIALRIPPLPAGLHGIEARLETDDALTVDNRRFAVFQCGEPLRLIIARPESRGEVATLTAAMIAPPAQDPTERLIDVEVVSGEELTADRLRAASALILADVDHGIESHWDEIRQYVSRGGWLFVLPGPLVRPEVYASAADFLPARIVGVADCPDGTTVAASDLTHPYLRPFEDPGNDSINSRRVFRRVELEGSAAARVLAPFSTRDPALLLRRVGQGQVVQFAFSPAPDWSQFGTQAAPMIVLLHTMLQSLWPPADQAGGFSAGGNVARRLPAGNAREVYVAGPSSGGARAVAVTGGAAFLPAPTAGIYDVSLDTAGRQILIKYGVNVPARESDAGRIAPEAVLELLPKDRALVVSDPRQLERRAAPGRYSRELLVPLGLVLLGLLMVESLFSNWFYRLGSGHRVAERNPGI